MTATRTKLLFTPAFAKSAQDPKLPFELDAATDQIEPGQDSSWRGEQPFM
jgi:hypothetical protein